jgi:hypothetical protein
VEPGVFYAVKGTQNADLANLMMVLNYLDLPVLIRFYIAKLGNVFGGP